MVGGKAIDVRIDALEEMGVPTVALNGFGEWGGRPNPLDLQYQKRVCITCT